MKRYLGIDLGGCMSGNSAYCLLQTDGDSFEILSLTKEPKHTDYLSCHDYLLTHILESKADKIGIDAPLSLPGKLLNIAYDSKPRDAAGEIANPFLFRDTDYYLFKTFGLRPMPPAGDRIGRLTARAMQLLQDESIKAYEDKIIEVYPKQIAQALGNVNYKKDKTWIYTMFPHLEASLDEHLIDAFLAAYALMHIDAGKTVYPPKKSDGWCYPLLNVEKRYEEVVSKSSNKA